MNNRSGFTLVEFSVVIVIIGLLIGALIAGKELVRASEIRAAISESIKYTQAIGAFKDKYRALPGDFSGATALWGATHITPATCIITLGTTATATCDGDDNGLVTTQSSYATTYYEQFRAWQHLANAQFIEGHFNGVPTSGTYAYTFGINIPTSKLTGAGWRMVSITAHDAATMEDITYSTGDIPPNLVLWLGGPYYEDTNRMTAVLTTAEALSIDQKIDDGQASLGRVVSQGDPFNTACLDANVPQQYDLAETTKTGNQCALVFKTGF